jgi:hypothetical protein
VLYTHKNVTVKPCTERIAVLHSPQPNLWLLSFTWCAQQYDIINCDLGVSVVGGWGSRQCGLHTLLVISNIKRLLADKDPEELLHEGEEGAQAAGTGAAAAAAATQGQQGVVQLVAMRCSLAPLHDSLRH